MTLSTKEWIELVGLAVGVATVVFIIIALLNRRRNTETDDQDEENDDLVLGQYTYALTAPDEEAKSKNSDLAQELRSAGYYRPTAVREYKAVRALAILLVVITTGSLLLIVPESYFSYTLFGGIVAVAAAFSLPRLFINLRAKSRSRAVEKGLPVAIDMLILCLSAGQNLLAALQLVANQLYRSHPVLAKELIIAHQQAELHSLDHSLRQWANRMKVPEVRNLVMLLIQSEKLGSDAASTLSELALNFRTNAKQRAEARANRLSFWMLFPSVGCFWVAAAIILIGPAYLEYFQYQRRASQLVDQSATAVQTANEVSGKLPVIPNFDSLGIKNESK